MNNESITIPTKDTPKPHNDKKVLLEAMKYRYATKKFDPEKIISDEDFETLLEAARLSPTSFGMEPWKILVIQNRKIREEMMPYGWGARAGLSGASHFVVFLANKREDITFGSPYADHMLKDIHQVPPEVYNFYSQVYTRFGKEEMKILDSERTALDWTSKQAYNVMANMMTMAAYMGIDSCPPGRLQSRRHDPPSGRRASPLRHKALRHRRHGRLRLSGRNTAPGQEQKAPLRIGGMGEIRGSCTA